jgi:hypothetical protein
MWGVWVGVAVVGCVLTPLSELLQSSWLNLVAGIFNGTAAVTFLWWCNRRFTKTYGQQKKYRRFIAVVAILAFLLMVGNLIVHFCYPSISLV